MKHPTNYLDRSTIRYKWRRARFAIVERILSTVLEKRGRATIIDVGGSVKYWNLFESSLAASCTVVLVNEPSWLQQVPAHLNNGVKLIAHPGDGCNLEDFSDGEFDLAHSNSVIEHVGSFKRMIDFASELRRVGRNYYCQTPNLWFPIEPHFGVPIFHWLPAPTQARLVHRHAVGWKGRISSYEKALDYVDHIRMLNKYMFMQLFPDSTLHLERVAFLTKSFVAYRTEGAQDPFRNVADIALAKPDTE